MNQHLFNALTPEVKRKPVQTVKNMSEEEGGCGAGAWVKLLRTCKGKSASRSQRLTERVHDIKRLSYSEVLARMDMKETFLKEHAKDKGWTSPWRIAQDVWYPLILHADLQKMSHIVFHSDVKKYSIDQFGLRLRYDRKRSQADLIGVKPMDTSLARAMKKSQERHLALIGQTFML